MLITVPKSFGTGGMQSVVEKQERFRLMRRWVFKPMCGQREEGNVCCSSPPLANWSISLGGD